MSAIRVKHRPTKELEDWEVKQLQSVFADSFVTEPDPALGLKPYLDNVAGVLIAQRARTIVAFQFYQQVEVDGRSVHHFSLSGKSAGAPRGVQIMLGRRVITRAVLRTAPWRTIYVAGCTNDVRAYSNFHRLGRCFPDVLEPENKNPFGKFYLDVSRHLGFPPPDELGRLPARMDVLRFKLKPVAVQSPLGKSYLEFVKGDLRIGLFVMIGGKAWRDLPRFATGALSRIFQRRHAAR